MYRQLIRLACLASVVTGVACASASGGGAPGATQAGAPRDRTQITAADMQGVGANNLYDAVQRLHPEWLQRRAAPTTGRQRGVTQSTDNDVAVYVGEQRAGNSDFLKTMVIGSATVLKYYSAGDAQGKFGTGTMNPVIQIVTR